MKSFDFSARCVPAALAVAVAAQDVADAPLLFTFSNQFATTIFQISVLIAVFLTSVYVWATVETFMFKELSFESIRNSIV